MFLSDQRHPVSALFILMHYLGFANNIQKSRPKESEIFSIVRLEKLLGSELEEIDVATNLE